MTELQLQILYGSLLAELFPRKKYEVQIVFSRSKTVRHTIELKSNTIHIRLSPLLRTSPEPVMEALAHILIAKLFRKNINRQVKQVYDAYVKECVLPDIAPAKRRISAQYTARGSYYNLNEIFNALNAEYFESKLIKPQLGWSLNRSYTRLGFYDAQRNLLVISRIFDSKRAKKNVLEFLMYHEMLHIFIPAKSINGRRRIHTAEFRNLERKFPQYAEIQKWLNRKRYRL